MDFLCTIAWWVVIVPAVVSGIGLGGAVPLAFHRSPWAIPMAAVFLVFLAIAVLVASTVSRLC